MAVYKYRTANDAGIKGSEIRQFVSHVNVTLLPESKKVNRSV